MILVHRIRRKALLAKMTIPFFSKIDVPCVTTMSLSHGVTEAVRMLWNGNEMNVLCEVQNYVKLVRPPPLISPPFKTFFSTFIDITTHNSVR